MPSREDIQLCKRSILAVVTGERMPLAEARRRVQRVMRSDSPVELAYEELLAEMAANMAVHSAVTNPETYSGPGAAWYVEPDAQPSWNYYRSRLEASGSPELDELELQTTEIVTLLADPNTPGSRRKGLVMGN